MPTPENSESTNLCSLPIPKVSNFQKQEKSRCAFYSRMSAIPLDCWTNIRFILHFLIMYFRKYLDFYFFCLLLQSQRGISSAGYSACMACKRSRVRISHSPLRSETASKTSREKSCKILILQDFSLHLQESRKESAAERAAIFSVHFFSSDSGSRALSGPQPPPRRFYCATRCRTQGRLSHAGCAGSSAVSAS